MPAPAYPSADLCRFCWPEVMRANPLAPSSLPKNAVAILLGSHPVSARVLAEPGRPIHHGPSGPASHRDPHAQLHRAVGRIRRNSAPDKALHSVQASGLRRSGRRVGRGCCRTESIVKLFQIAIAAAAMAAATPSLAAPPYVLSKTVPLARAGPLGLCRVRSGQRPGLWSRMGIRSQWWTDARAR